MTVTQVELAETLERHRADLQRAARDYYIEHVIDRAQFLAVRDDVDRILGHERKELFPLRVRDMLARLDTKTPRVAWNTFELPQRREMLAAVLDHVVVHPAPRDNRFHPERVEIFWLGQDSLRPSATRAVPPPKRRRAKPDARLTARQAADYLGIKEETVMRLIRKGDLVGMKGEHGWDLAQATLDKLLQDRRVRATRAAATRSASA